MLQEESIRMTNRSREWSLGLFFLCCVVVLWVMSSVVLNKLFDQGVYSKPFLITWFNTASFTLYLIPYYLKKWKSENNTKKSPPDELSTTEESSLVTDNGNSIDATDHNQNMKIKPLTFRETVILSFSFCLLWFLSNFFNNASLAFTSVSSQTILSSTSSFFTMIVGYIFNQESFTKTKVISLVGLFIGVLCVTLNDDPQTQESSPFKTILTGDILALLGALCYGVYSILLKLRIKDDSRVDMKLFFGFVGAFNTLILWPSLVIVHFLGFETFALPPTRNIWMVIIFNCAISFLADFLWARAMLLTSPLTVTVGLCLTIPLALICDILFQFKLNSPIYFFGAFLVCLSFYWINKNEQKDSNLLV